MEWWGIFSLTLKRLPLFELFSLGSQKGLPLQASSFWATFSLEFFSSLGTSSSWGTSVYLASLSRCGNRCSGDLDIVEPDEKFLNTCSTKQKVTSFRAHAKCWNCAQMGNLQTLTYLSKIALDSRLFCVLVELVKPKGLILKHLERGFIYLLAGKIPHLLMQGWPGSY